jgi:hypothetical protein
MIDQVQRVISHSRETLGEPAGLTIPTGYPYSLALCVLDAVWSMGVRYGGVAKVVGRYRGYRASVGADADLDDLPDLLAVYQAVGGDEDFAARIGNRQRTSTRHGAVTKATAVRQAAQALTVVGITTTGELRAQAGSSTLAEPKSAWLTVPGQRSGISWRYLLLLARVPEVKPDRMLRRYVAEALGEPDVPAELAAQLVMEAAEQLRVSPIALDHAIWRYQRSRPAVRKNGASASR